jgi:hypothetical protein
MSNGNRRYCEATLLMESHGLAPDVRSNSFASLKVWSKLYQAGSYFVDLALGPGEHGLGLRGEILTQDETPVPSEGTVTLHDRTGEIMASASLGDASNNAEAAFVFDVEHIDDYHLEVVFEQEVLSVAGIDVR